MKKFPIKKIVEKIIFFIPPLNTKASYLGLKQSPTNKKKCVVERKVEVYIQVLSMFARSYLHKYTYLMNNDFLTINLFGWCLVDWIK